MELKCQIAKQFFDSYSQECVNDLNEFKSKHLEIYLQPQEPFKKDYDQLLFFLAKIMENKDMVNCSLFEFDNDQKVFELGLYFLAKEVINEITQQQCNEYMYLEILTLKQEIRILKENECKN